MEGRRYARGNVLFQIRMREGAGPERKNNAGRIITGMGTVGRCNAKAVCSCGDSV